jgi:penicillin V acylase-like amidase (Ntn superfamily)
MWLEGTGYPPADERPGVMELQWIQYHLDNSTTVAEVIAKDSSMRISGTQAMSKLHYLVCDRQGNVAAIEFLEGELVYHTGATLPVAALTNSTYDQCEAYLRATDTMTTGAAERVTSYASRDRFVRIAGALGEFEAKDNGSAVEYAFDMLQSVQAPRNHQHRTAWSIVYDVKHLTCHFKTYENQTPRTFTLTDLDFSCATPIQVLGMNGETSGDVTGEFVAYELSANEELVTRVIAEYNAAGFLVGVPERLVLNLARYPERVTCK